MNTDYTNKIIYKELSYKLIGIAMEVHNKLGCGFLEKVYENSMIVLLNKEGIKHKNQFPIKVYFEEYVVGEYIADIFIEDKIILELKAVETLNDIHKAQLINYLKATKCKLGMLINFGSKKLEYQRFVL